LCRSRPPEQNSSGLALQDRQPLVLKLFRLAQQTKQIARAHVL